MKYKCLVFLVMGLIMISACTPDTEQEQASKQATTEADLAAINDNINRYESAMNAGDLDLWISLWADDAIQMAPDAPAVIGKEQIRAIYESIFSQFILKMIITNEEVRVAGDLSFSRGNYTLSMTPKAGGETIKIDGKYLSIEERQADGSWKIIRSCFNSNAPLPPPK